MGADYFELGETDSSQPPIGIGRNCVIDRAIIDKNARIADGVVITPEGKPPNLDARQLLHPRRHRGDTQKRSRPSRFLDLKSSWIGPPKRDDTMAMTLRRQCCITLPTR